MAARAGIGSQSRGLPNWGKLGDVPELTGSGTSNSGLFIYWNDMAGCYERRNS